MSPDFPCKVKIIMKNGIIYEKTIGNVKGGKKRPMNINDLKIKFLECSKNKQLFDLLLDSNTEKSSKFIDKFLAGENSKMSHKFNWMNIDNILW